MRTLIQAALGVSVVVTAFLLGFYVQYSQTDSSKPVTEHRTEPADPVATVIGQHQPNYTLHNLLQESVSHEAFAGQVVLVNFWATWCPPCLREIPGFIELKNELGPQGFEIVGIAIDQIDKVRAFADSMGINYPILIGQQDALAIAESFGNRLGALPYSALVDRQGIVRYLHSKGELSKQDAQREIEKLL